METSLIDVLTGLDDSTPVRRRGDASSSVAESDSKRTRGDVEVLPVASLMLPEASAQTISTIDKLRAEALEKDNEIAAMRIAMQEGPNPGIVVAAASAAATPSGEGQNAGVLTSIEHLRSQQLQQQQTLVVFATSVESMTR